MLSKKMIKLIDQQKLGFVASVDVNGRPNVSPKGTFVVLDEHTLVFSEIRSPNTLKNIAHNPEVEVNFVDPFTRKGVRVRGNTITLKKNEGQFNDLFHHFEQWGDLANSIRHIIIINITQAKELSSPIYDLGADEDELIKVWFDKFTQMHPQ